MKKNIVSLLIVGLAFLMVACSGDNEESEEQIETEVTPETTQIEMTEDEQVDVETVVAKVNGKEIKGDMFNFVYAQIKVGVHQLGYDAGDQNSLKEMAVSILINQELLKQDAEKRNITVSDSEIDSEYETFKSNVDNQLAALVNQPELPEESYKDQLHFELIHEKYLDSEIEDVDVADKEVEETYDSLKEQNENMPALEDIKEQLKNELVMQKEQELVQSKVEQLEAEADIETLI